MLNRKPLVPPPFGVPERLETARFILSMLTIHNVVRDDDAVMSSTEHLQTTGRLCRNTTGHRGDRQPRTVGMT
ncbi:MAG: hypothetical protein P8Q36_01630 [Alphaproteobacteria bacterium]|jgi:hypothetical protein|nr:hypothetical protein [Rhodospirillaceae bacterium]MBT6202724.1 hypothetical protein [Rhodospirillaceae bacterium]MBT6510247.1 hypothetical protein [Rhodospirillaceae bacterium]MBT7646933.1 hypothetical protein [Rhodospirillaceae bacterium]MDG2479556.1 hypothetical protein [Alphaproteobacteria bacterium]